MSETYKKAGVDIEQGERTIKDIKSEVRKTYNHNVLTDLGHFGGMYLFDKNAHAEPVLVSSTDGVGTKLKVAFLMDKHDSVGEDLVNHCVNDIAVGGATPLFFLDYFATAGLDSEVFKSVMSGFVRGCINNNCALIGGETAEMPDMYTEGEYDISGTIVGVVDKELIIDGSKIKKSDILIGLNSSGLHTNGYSLARKILLKHFKINDYNDELGCTIGEELLKVHLSYLSIIQKAINKYNVKGIAHITGGGIEGNTRRLLQSDLDLMLDWDAWNIPYIFNLIATQGKVPADDMRRTFNLGIGLVFIVEEKSSQAFSDFIKAESYHPVFIGEVI